jgi:LysM repeat protein
VTSPLRVWLGRFTTGVTATGLLLLGLPAVVGAPGPGAGPAATSDVPAGVLADPLDLVSHRKKHPYRKIKKYKVRPGDTASAIAVRYHAWTDQLIELNHTTTLYVGQVIRIPVVVKAARECTRHRHHRTGYPASTKPSTKKHPKKHAKKHAGKPGKKHDKPASKPKKPPKPKSGKPHRPGHHVHRHPHRGWVHGGASRAQVRHAIGTKARRVGVAPHLALAIAWQESGWQHKQVSSAGALGAMQVMPGTGRWMSAYLGRRLNLRNLHHNVTAGVVLIKVLRGETGLKRTIAGYYQGLAGVRRYGMYDSTKRYVANVLAIKKALGRGWDPS